MVINKSALGFVEDTRLLSKAFFLLKPLLVPVLLAVVDFVGMLVVSAGGGDAAALVATTTGLSSACGSVPGTKRRGGLCGTCVAAPGEDDKE